MLVTKMREALEGRAAGVEGLWRGGALLEMRGTAGGSAASGGKSVLVSNVKEKHK